MEKARTARELAARALCRHEGRAADDLLDGKAAWESYLPVVDVVLQAVGFADYELIPVYRFDGPSTKT